MKLLQMSGCGVACSLAPSQADHTLSAAVAKMETVRAATSAKLKAVSIASSRKQQEKRALDPSMNVCVCVSASVRITHQ